MKTAHSDHCKHILARIDACRSVAHLKRIEQKHPQLTKFQPKVARALDLSLSRGFGSQAGDDSGHDSKKWTADGTVAGSISNTASFENLF